MPPAKSVRIRPYRAGDGKALADLHRAALLARAEESLKSFGTGIQKLPPASPPPASTSGRGIALPVISITPLEVAEPFLRL